jgi:transcriptional regulator with XRE-family HTH domain
VTEQRLRPDPLWRQLAGSVLRDERRRQGRTLREVADVAGISVPYLSEIERGRKEASSEMVAAAARALGLRLVDLLGRAHALLAEREGSVATEGTVAEGTRGSEGSLASVTELAPSPPPSSAVSLLAA